MLDFFPPRPVRTHNHKAASIYRRGFSTALLVGMCVLGHSIVLPQAVAEEVPNSTVGSHFLPWMKEMGGIEFRFKTVRYAAATETNDGEETIAEYQSDSLFRFCGGRFLYRVSAEERRGKSVKAEQSLPGERIVAYDGVRYYEVLADEHRTTARMGISPDVLSDGTLIFETVPLFIPFQPLLAAAGLNPQQALPNVLGAQKFLDDLRH